MWIRWVAALVVCVGCAESSPSGEADALPSDATVGDGARADAGADAELGADATAELDGGAPADAQADALAPDALAPDAGPACDAPDRCDGLDSDCDGVLDEAFSQVGEACPAGVFVCNADQDALVCGGGDLFAHPTCPEVTLTAPPPGLSPFYTRHVDVAGVALVGSDGVPEEAFRVAVYLMEQMFRQRPCYAAALARNGIRVGIMARDEVTTDMPEYSDFYEVFPGVDWDRRGRGFGATQERPLTTTAVESLLRDADDPWLGEIILLHELAHTVFEVGVEDQVGGAAQRARLTGLYRDAMAAGLWANTYAATNANEYWAEGVQSWLDDNLANERSDGVHGPVDTRVELTAYDPGLAALVADVFPGERWPTWCDPAGAGPALPRLPPESAACDWALAVVPLGTCEAPPASLNSDVEAQVTFINRRLEPVDVAWLDFDGQAQPFGSIPPRSRTGLSSFATHPWRFSAGGQCLGVAVTEPGENRIIIE